MPRHIVGEALQGRRDDIAAADINLSVDILNRIDHIVGPGVTINPDDNSYGVSELTPAARRRT